MKTLQMVKTSLLKLQGSKERITQEIEKLQKEQEAIIVNLNASLEARIVIQLVAQQTQEKLQYKISELGSLALAAVFPRPYKLFVEFIPRRGKTECDILFERDGEKFNPMEDSGGGAVDVAAFALRPSIWSLVIPRKRALFILDEPFSGLKGEVANEQILKIVHEISKRLSSQVIMIADERIDREVLAENCDSLMEVFNNNGISRISKIDYN